MNRHLSAIGAILRKDIQSLWPLASLVVALQVVQLLDGEFGLHLISAQAKQVLPFVYVTTYLFFVVAAFQQDAMASLRHDVLTRPIPRRDLLAAKGLLIWSAIFLPTVLGTFMACLIDGRSFVESILVATTIESSWLVTLVLLVVVIAAVTSTLIEAACAMIGLFIALLLIEPWASRLSSTGEAIFFLGSGWVLIKPLSLLALFSMALVIWLQYARRNTMRAHTALAVTALLLMSSPALFDWDMVFAVQKAVAAEPEAADPLKVSLTPDCFPSTLVNPPPAGIIEIPVDNVAARTSGIIDTNIGANDPTKASQIKINPTVFDQDRREEAGQSAIAFATAISPSGAPTAWKVMISRVNATYRGVNDEVLYAIRPARITPTWKSNADGSLSAFHFWLLPRDAYQRLTSQASHLQLEYSLSLLRPHSYELSVDGKRLYMPAVGYCGAVRDRVTADVTIKCFKTGAPPALIAAEMVGAPTTRVTKGDPNYIPAWLAFPGGQRQTITLHPTGPNISRVKVTAYEARAHTERKLVVPGVLGGPVNSCPAPFSE